MKKILLPIDFSERSEWTYDIAQTLAMADEAELHVLSVLPDSAAGLHALTHSGSDASSDEAEWQNRLQRTQQRLVDWISDKTAVTHHHVMIGEVNKSIVAYGDEIGADLIIMGKHARVDPDAWNTDSHTVYISNHTDIPVLSLKNGKKIVVLDHIAFVGDFLTHRHINLDVLKAIKKFWGSKLTLLCIRREKDARSYADIITDMRAFISSQGLENTEIFVVQGENIEAEVKKYSQEQEINLMAIGTHQNKELSKLFHHSISDELLKELDCPVLTLPLHQ